MEAEEEVVDKREGEFVFDRLNRVLICNGKIKKIRKGREKVKSLGLWGSVYHILS